MILVLLVGAVAPLFIYAQVLAAGEAFVGGADVTGLVNESVAIDDLSITGSGNDTLTINLYVVEGELALGTTTGITGYVEPAAELTITGTRSDINTAITTLTFHHTRTGTFTLDATIVSGGGEVYNPANGHVYVVVLADPGITWDDARTAAEAMDYNGADGYLVTITDAEENDFVGDRLPSGGWVGAADLDSEGDWQWVGGPEAGQAFWNGTSADTGGTPVGGRYNAWEFGQPDDYNDEDCMEIYAFSYTWNDQDCAAERSGYIVEFGADGDNPEVTSTQIQMTLEGENIEIENCDELMALDPDADVYANISVISDVDCEGKEFEPLFSEGDGFAGTFDGNGFTISNVEVAGDGSTPVGLIARSAGAILHDLNLDNFVLSNDGYVGALSAIINNSQVTNVHVSNVEIVTTDGWAGGISGDISSNLEGANLYRVSATGTITSSGYGNVGGVAGFAEANSGEFTVEQAFADVDINIANSAEEDFGGLIGELEIDDDDDAGNADAVATVRNAYAWGDIEGGDQNFNSGGLIGSIDHTNGSDYETTAVIENVYANGNVIGGSNVGGLIGYAEAPNDETASSIENSFAMGLVTASAGASHRGGFIGQLETGSVDYMTSSNNYWDQNRSGQELCDQDEIVADCNAVNADGSEVDYFINNNENPPLDAWNFDTIWETNVTMPPTFEWQESLNDGSVSFISPLTGKGIELAITGDCSFEALFSTEADLTAKDSGYEYPNGLVGFNADCEDEGMTVTVTQTYYEVSMPGAAVRKYNPTTHAFFTVVGVSTQIVSIDGAAATRVTYQVTDGGELDADGLVDGHIYDPVGLGSLSVSSPNTGLRNILEFLQK